MKPLSYYRQHGSLSDPGPFAEALAAVPPGIDAIVATVQGLLLHDYFALQFYDEPPPAAVSASRETLPIVERLRSFDQFPDQPLTEPRPTSRRRIGTCRDFALLTCAILREQGTPARVRCGFAGYFHPPTFEDHWICEYWDTDRSAWRLVDAQLDAAHIEHLSITFDPTDVPRDAFAFPWQVWERFGETPEKLEDFGHGEAKGVWFVRVNLARDLLALTKQEVSDWDNWRTLEGADGAMDAEAKKHCDDLSGAAKLLDQS